ncbi:MAG: FmdB family zinc ribbon protein [bacterium]
MPTYEYLCESCGHKFDKFQNMYDLPIEKCPKCGREIRRLVSPGAGIIFKGNGFYQTDYKSHHTGGGTCCGREERCDKPPCSDDGVCKR